MALKLGKPVEVQELLAKPTGRKLSERDVELNSLVLQAADENNIALAFPWDYEPEKVLTARAALQRAIKRNGLEGHVFVSSRPGLLYVSQMRLSNKGRPKS